MKFYLRNSSRCQSQVFYLAYLIICEIVDHRVGERLIQHWIHDLLKMRLCNAKIELKQILADWQEHAMTYNHYYTENIQKIHQQR